MALKSPWSRIAPVGPMYRLSFQTASFATTGSTTGTVSYSVFSMQWVSTNTVFIPTYFDVQMTVESTLTTYQDIPFGLYIVRNYTTPASGGTAATFATTKCLQMGQLDSRFATTNFAANGAINWLSSGVLTAGVGTVDNYPIHTWNYGQYFSTTAGVPQFRPAVFGAYPNTQAPFIRNNEGLILQQNIATLGTGAIALTITMEWIEMDVGKY